MNGVIAEMDDLDQKLIATLRQNARLSYSELSHVLDVSRSTVRARMERLEARGVIRGYTVVMRGDVAPDAVRGLMMVGIAGRGTDRILHSLRGLPEVRRVHATNGQWDLILELGTETLAQFDDVLSRIRRFDGIERSETNLLLATRKGA